MDRVTMGWILLFLVGLIAISAGLGLVALPVPNFADLAYIGLSTEDIRRLSPRLANWAWHESKQAAFDWIPLGIFISGLAFLGVRRREKWAWSLLALGTMLYFLGYLTIHEAIDLSYPVLRHFAGTSYSWAGPK